MSWKVKRARGKPSLVARLAARAAHYDQLHDDRRTDLQAAEHPTAGMVMGPLVAHTVAAVLALIELAVRRFSVPERLLPLGQSLHWWTQRYVKALIADVPPAYQPACRAGCAACCVIPVTIRPMEAMTIAEKLKK